MSPSRNRGITHCELGFVQFKVGRRKSLSKDVSILIEGRNINNLKVMRGFFGRGPMGLLETSLFLFLRLSLFCLLGDLQFP